MLRLTVSPAGRRCFWGILCYAKNLEAERRQEQHPVSKVIVLTDLSPDVLDPVKDAFIKNRGLL